MELWLNLLYDLFIWPSVIDFCARLDWHLEAQSVKSPAKLFVMEPIVRFVCVCVCVQAYGMCVCQKSRDSEG